jgi:hypothetical protein
MNEDLWSPMGYQHNSLRTTDLYRLCKKGQWNMALVDCHENLKSHITAVPFYGVFSDKAFIYYKTFLKISQTGTTTGREAHIPSFKEFKDTNYGMEQQI